MDTPLRVVIDAAIGHGHQRTHGATRASPATDCENTPLPVGRPYPGLRDQTWRTAIRAPPPEACHPVCLPSPFSVAVLAEPGIATL